MTGEMPRRAILALGLVGVVAGCGFQPVYMETATGAPGPAARNLAAIRVNLIPDRPGQLLRQALQKRFGGSLEVVPTRYRLAVGYSISGQGIGITSSDIATRIRMVGTASWVLTAMNTPQSRITSGSARYMDGIDVFDQQYFAADLDTEAVQRRMATHLADDIAMELAAFFRHQAAVTAR